MILRSSLLYIRYCTLLSMQFAASAAHPDLLHYSTYCYSALLCSTLYSTVRTYARTAIRHRSIIVLYSAYERTLTSLPCPACPGLTLLTHLTHPLACRCKKPQGRKGCSQMALLHSYWPYTTGKPGECGDVCFCTMYFVHALASVVGAFGPLRPAHSYVPRYSALHDTTP